MKIEAIRISEVGRFRDPIAIEGFSGKLDLLVGPNEAGKSTLFHALETVFRLPHTSKAEAARMLRPYDGGGPTIECDFETGGRHWRLVKRYLSAASAELRDRDTGRIWKGADAETQLQSLVAGTAGRDRFMSMVWVAQGTGFDPPKLEDGGASRLVRLMEREIEAASGAGLIAGVRALTRSALDDMVTASRAQPRAGSAYQKALADVATLRLRHEQARTVAKASAAARDQLASLAPRLAGLIDSATVAARGRAIIDARAALEAARLARSGLAGAEAIVKAANESHRAAVSAHERLTNAAAALSDAEYRIAKAATEEAALAARLAEADAGRFDAEAHYAAAVERLAAARARFRLVELDRRLAEIAQRIGEAEAASAMVARCRTELAAIRLDEPGARTLHRAAETIALLGREIAAEAAAIVVDYEPGQVDAVTIDGVALAGGRSVAVDRPVTLVIAGIGTVRLSPGGGSLAERTRRRDEASAVLVAGLAGAGVSTIEAADRLIEQRRQLEAEMRHAEATLAAVARDGVAPLTDRAEATRGERDEAEAALADLTCSPADDDVADARTVQLRAHAMEVAERTAREAARAAGNLANQLAGVTARLAAERQRHQDIAAGLPPAAEREAVLAQASDAVSTGERALNVAVLELRALRATVPDDAAIGELTKALATAERTKLAADEEIGRLQTDIARLEAGLARDDEAGVGAQAIEFAERQAEAERRLADYDLELEALRLLDAELQRVSAGHHQSVVAPVLRRLESMAPSVIRNAGFAMGEGFVLSGLKRGGHQESLDRLSGGTREQIAVLARLAYARLLADQGYALPVVLDDALVHADDARLDAMFAVLAEAAAHHQVIVLTCHETAFGAIGRRHGGHMLVFDAWMRAAA